MPGEGLRPERTIEKRKKERREAREAARKRADDARGQGGREELLDRIEALEQRVEILEQRLPD